MLAGEGHRRPRAHQRQLSGPRQGRPGREGEAPGLDRAGKGRHAMIAQQRSCRHGLCLGEAAPLAGREAQAALAAAGRCLPKPPLHLAQSNGDNAVLNFIVELSGHQQPRPRARLDRTGRPAPGPGGVGRQGQDPVHQGGEQVPAQQRPQQVGPGGGQRRCARGARQELGGGLAHASRAQLFYRAELGHGADHEGPGHRVHQHPLGVPAPGQGDQRRVRAVALALGPARL